MGKLVLVGAGPGDPELITIRGLKAIKQANVILYDALIDERLLENAPENCEKIFVGKRGYQQSLSQMKINEMCVEYCKSNNHVIRLKGGDPFIFGRGHEEVEYAALFGIESEVIPGLSSITSLSTLHGVPLTRRNITSGFTVVTAVNKDGDLTDELIDAVKKDLTLVILMGLKKLNKICDLYKVRNKEKLPVMIIQNGSLPNEKCVVGTIETIEVSVVDKNINSPAIIIIGEVVGVKQKELEVSHV
jgi:uroporphyrin-III C-methyltransferase